jgi:predicted DNA-binding protein with PD1-like motif
MEYSEARMGRIFVIRLEDGEVLHESVERLAAERGVAAAALIVIGGAAAGSTLVVGPEDGAARPVSPMVHVLKNAHEVTGVGTLFPDENGKPTLHMHIACGRGDKTVAGCVRRGVKIWQVCELIMIELRGTEAVRGFHPELGFTLLSPGGARGGHGQH